jgi:glutaredoxin
MQIEIFTKIGCPACDRAKQILTSHNYTYTEHVLGETITREEIKQRFPNASSVPIIIVDSVRVGSIGQLQLLLEQSKSEVLHG